jgi:hypothetical protein
VRLGPGANTDSHADSNANPNANPNADNNADSNADSNANSNSNAYTDGYAHADPDAHPDTGRRHLYAVPDGDGGVPGQLDRIRGGHGGFRSGNGGCREHGTRATRIDACKLVKRKCHDTGVHAWNIRTGDEHVYEAGSVSACGLHAESLIEAERVADPCPVQCSRFRC